MLNYQTLAYCVAICGILTSIILSYLDTEDGLKSQTHSLQISIENLRHAACDSDLLIYKDNKCKSFHAPNANNCEVAVTFASMIDLKLRLIDIMPYLDPPNEAKYHSTIKSKQQFLETLASCFNDGTAAEFRIDKITYEEIISIISKLDHQRNLGGNAMMIAFRMAQEGCKVHLLSPLTQEMADYFHTRLVPVNPLIEKSDYHIVFEYSEGEKWGKYIAPRSNRFYANHDIANIDPAVFDGLKNLSDNVKLVAIGGLQLIQGTENELNFIKKISEEMDILRLKNIKIHIEMGDFHNNMFYDELQQIFTKSDSIGLNEQELGKLLSHLNSVKFRGYPSKASLNEYLPDLESLLSALREKKFKTNRVHLHTIYSQVICSNEKWADPLIPAARSALISGQYACNTTDIQLKNASFFEGSVKLNSTDLNFNSEKITHCWDSISDMKCCIALVPTCTNVISVTALGDNISAMGLSYHNILN